MKELYDETLTLDHIHASMDTLFTTNYSETAKATVNAGNTNKELQLFYINCGRGGRGRGGRGGRGRGRFVCFNCGKSGHTASHCRSTKSSENNNVRHCNFCGKNGHLEHTCWLKPGNKVQLKGCKTSLTICLANKKKWKQQRNYSMLPRCRL
jgi:hypothetical protein